MTNHFFILAMSLGLDSLIVGLALGAAITLKQRWRLALAFGVCDGMASLIGWAAGAPLWRGLPGWCDWLGPLAVAGYGIGVLAFAWREHKLANRGELTMWGWLGLTLPLCLSLDNLATGTGAASSAASAILACAGFAIVSGVLAMAGMTMGDAVAHRLRPRAEWVSGSALVLVAAVMMLKEIVL